MNSLLRYVYVESRCNACGGSLDVTLLDMFMEHQVRREWRSPRPCGECALENMQLMRVLPERLVEDLNRAWEEVAAAASAAGLELRLGLPNAPGPT
jgi:hypothetical protein